jgi:flagellar basal body-associated protein FliL
MGQKGITVTKKLTVIGTNHNDLFVKRAIETAANRVNSATAKLVREPRNPRDKNAIAVIYDGSRIGYIDAEHAAKWSSSLPMQVPLGAEGTSLFVTVEGSFSNSASAESTSESDDKKEKKEAGTRERPRPQSKKSPLLFLVVGVAILALAIIIIAVVSGGGEAEPEVVTPPPVEIYEPEPQEPEEEPYEEEDEPDPISEELEAYRELVANSLSAYSGAIDQLTEAVSAFENDGSIADESGWDTPMRNALTRMNAASNDIQNRPSSPEGLEEFDTELRALAAAMRLYVRAMHDWADDPSDTGRLEAITSTLEDAENQLDVVRGMREQFELSD